MNRLKKEARFVIISFMVTFDTYTEELSRIFFFMWIILHLFLKVEEQSEENLLAEYHRFWIQFSKGTQYLNHLYS